MEVLGHRLSLSIHLKTCRFVWSHGQVQVLPTTNYLEPKLVGNPPICTALLPSCASKRKKEKILFEIVTLTSCMCPHTTFVFLTSVVKLTVRWCFNKPTWCQNIDPMQHPGSHVECMKSIEDGRKHINLIWPGLWSRLSPLCGVSGTDFKPQRKWRLRAPFS